MTHLSILKVMNFKATINFCNNYGGVPLYYNTLDELNDIVNATLDIIGQDDDIWTGFDNSYDCQDTACQGLNWYA